jgi:hypothetical protein
VDAKRLYEIEARAAGATAGPWHALDGAAEGFDGSWDVGGPDNCCVASMAETAEAARLPRDKEANAEFIAAARTDVPALVAECRRLAAELAAARKREAGLREAMADLMETHDIYGPGNTGAEQRARAALTAPPAGEGDGWVPVGERLPDVQERVIAIAVPSGGVHPYNVIGYVDSFGAWRHSEHGWHLPPVSHWRPLPAAPAAGTGQ